MLACRGRYHPTQWRNLPKIWPQGFSGPMNRAAFQDRVGFGIRLMAFSTAGLIVGQSAGYILGAWRSSQIIKREGNYEEIERVMLKVKKDLEDEFTKQNAHSHGGRISPTQRRKLQGQPQETADDTPSSTTSSGNRSSDVDFYGRSSRDGLENSRLARSFEKDEYGSGARERMWGESSFAKDLGAGPSTPDSGSLFGSSSSESTTAQNEGEFPCRR